MPRAHPNSLEFCCGNKQVQQESSVHPEHPFITPELLQRQILIPFNTGKIHHVGVQSGKSSWKRAWSSHLGERNGNTAHGAAQHSQGSFRNSTNPWERLEESSGFAPWKLWKNQIPDAFPFSLSWSSANNPRKRAGASMINFTDISGIYQDKMGILCRKHGISPPKFRNFLQYYLGLFLVSSFMGIFNLVREFLWLSPADPLLKFQFFFFCIFRNRISDFTSASTSQR